MPDDLQSAPLGRRDVLKTGLAAGAAALLPWQTARADLPTKTRPGIRWSDGVPFSAEDVAYTLNTLRDLGAKVRWGIDVQQAVEKAIATDANTVVVDFKIPSPRFFFFMTYKYDIGVYIV